MAKIVVFHERHELLLPFRRVGLEKYSEGMDARRLEIGPMLDDYECSKTIVGFVASSEIEHQLLLDLKILGVRQTAGFVSAHILGKHPFLRPIVVPQRQNIVVECAAKALRDLHVDCALRVVVSRPINP